MKSIKTSGALLAAAAAITGALALAGPASAAPAPAAPHGHSHQVAAAPREQARVQPASPTTQGNAALHRRDEERARRQADVDRNHDGGQSPSTDPGFTPPEPPQIPFP